MEFLVSNFHNWVTSQGSHSQILMTGKDGGGGGEGSDRGSYFIPKKIATSEFAYPKKSLIFLAYPKKSLSPFSATQKTPLFFLRPKKIPASFIDPKNHFGQKFQTRKNHSEPPPPPPVIKICKWGPWEWPLCFYSFDYVCIYIYKQKLKRRISENKETK